MSKKIRIDKNWVINAPWTGIYHQCILTEDDEVKKGMTWNNCSKHKLFPGTVGVFCYCGQPSRKDVKEAQSKAVFILGLK